jgi:hypothetical protein
MESSNEVDVKDLERLYSCSQWNRRTSPDEVVKLHIKVALEGRSKIDLWMLLWGVGK